MDQENFERIRAVENSFRPPGKPLANPGRVLVGEGRLMKLCRHRPMPRVFFLFNDVLVYGSIILNGRWNKRQQIIPLGEPLRKIGQGTAQRQPWAGVEMG